MLDVAVKLIALHDTSCATLHVAFVMVGSVKMRRVDRSCDNIIVAIEVLCQNVRYITLNMSYQ